MNHAASQSAFERSKRLIPGGVNSPVRAFRSVGGTPVFVRSGSGATFTDVDGNTYIDYVLSWGPLILGHANPAVLDAVRAAAARGTSFGAPTEAESELAELVIEMVPSVEKVRFCSSGTEATMSALRLARGFTGRERLIKFAGCYHGHGDAFLISAGSGALTNGVPDSPGITAGVAADTIVVEFNDLEAVATAFAAHPDQIAAVIVEPVVGNMGLVLPQPGFLAGLRDLTRKAGALLIFDEVMTGFRVSRGGVQGRAGILPDLTTLGKVIGGGLPVGAFGGRADIMAALSPEGPVYQAGTLSGNPLAMAAGIATLRALRDDALYEQFERIGTRLIDGFEQVFVKHGVPHTTARAGSMFGFFFAPTPVTNLTSAKSSNVSLFGKFFHGMLDRGIYLAPSQFEAGFLSTAHTEDQVDKTIAAADDTLAELFAGARA
jgi:glutamate-1-semialdehyde 2,1-aminomutase